MAQHIGIVGCSAEGAALAYRTICTEAPAFMGGHGHPEITMHTPSLAGYVACLEAGDMSGVAALMLRSARILADAGADFLICPDNTIHQAMDLMRPKSPLPWLHIAEVVADEAARRGLSRLAVLGTCWLMESDVYPSALAARGIDCATPEARERARIGRIIMDELVTGRIRPDSVTWLRDIAVRMVASGCDGVILGCTELPLVMDEATLGGPALDSTRLLARVAIDRALAGQDVG